MHAYYVATIDPGVIGNSLSGAHIPRRWFDATAEGTTGYAYSRLGGRIARDERFPDVDADTACRVPPSSFDEAAIEFEGCRSEHGFVGDLHLDEPPQGLLHGRFRRGVAGIDYPGYARPVVLRGAPPPTGGYQLILPRVEGLARVHRGNATRLNYVPDHATTLRFDLAVDKVPGSGSAALDVRVRGVDDELLVEWSIPLTAVSPLVMRQLSLPDQARGSSVRLEFEVSGIREVVPLAASIRLDNFAFGRLDSDRDGLEDWVDTDDDNDGMPDTFELTHGLNPLDAGDAVGDLDGDGVNNLDEYLSGTDPNVADGDNDSTRPVDGPGEPSRPRNGDATKALLPILNQLLDD